MTSAAQLVSDKCAGAGSGDPKVMDERRTPELELKNQTGRKCTIYKRKKAAGMRKVVEQLLVVDRAVQHQPWQGSNAKSLIGRVRDGGLSTRPSNSGLRASGRILTYRDGGVWRRPQRRNPNDAALLGTNLI